MEASFRFDYSVFWSLYPAVALLSFTSGSQFLVCSFSLLVFVPCRSSFKLLLLFVQVVKTVQVVTFVIQYLSSASELENHRSAAPPLVLIFDLSRASGSLPQVSLRKR